MAAAWRRRHVHVLWHKHGSLPPQPHAIMRSVAKYGGTGRTVDGIVTVTPTVVAQMRRRGVPRARVHNLLNGIDVDRFKPPDEEEWRRAGSNLGLEPGDTVVLHFGWWWDIKGGDLFLQAVDRLRTRGRRVVGVTVGGGGPARALAAELELTHEVRVVDPVSDVRELHAAADVFAATSRAEGMPFAVLEVVAAGVPVVMSTIPPHRGLAQHVTNARLAGLDPDELADATVALLDRDKASVLRATEQSRRWIRENMTLDSWAARLLALYEQVLSDGRATPVAASG